MSQAANRFSKLVDEFAKLYTPEQPMLVETEDNSDDIISP